MWRRFRGTLILNLYRLRCSIIRYAERLRYFLRLNWESLHQTYIYWLVSSFTLSNVNAVYPVPSLNVYPPFLHTAHRLNVEPSRCVVLEDSISGIQAGLAAGMRVVACPDPRAFLSDPDSTAYLQRFKDLTPHVIQSFDELLGVDVSHWGLKSA